MDKGTKLLGQSKEAAEVERKPANSRRVRDFLARYSENEPASFALTKKPVEPLTKKTTEQGTVFRFVGNLAATIPDGMNSQPDPSLSEATCEEFPLIELPAASDEAVAATFTTASVTQENPCSFIPSTPMKHPEVESAPPIQPSEWAELEKKVDSVQAEGEGVDLALAAAGQGNAFGGDEKRNSRAELRATDTPRVLGEGRNFRILDADSLESEKTSDTERTPSQPASEQGAMNLEHTVPQYVGQPEKSERFSDAQNRSAAQGFAQPRQTPEISLDQSKNLLAAENGETDTIVLSGDLNDFQSLSPEPSFVAFENADHLLRPEDEFVSQEVDDVHWKQTSIQDIETSPWITHDEFIEKTNQAPSEPARQFSPEEKEKLDPCLVSFLTPDSPEAEQYRMLGRFLKSLKKKCGRSCVAAVTSPSVGDGKTTTAVNLAGALAQDSATRVLLIDADCLHPAVLERLGKQSVKRGLVEAVVHPRLRLRSLAIHYASLNLTVLPAGLKTSSSHDIFSSLRFGSLLEEARRDYDYIILDMPSLTSLPDSRLVEKVVDGFFVVVAAHRTRRKLVQATVTGIAAEKMLGFVFNNADPQTCR